MAMGTEAMFEYGSDSVFPKVLEIKGLPWLLHISDWNIQKTCPHQIFMMTESLLKQWEILHT